MRTVRVSASKGYDVLVGQGLFSRAGELVRKTTGGAAAVVVTDDTVRGLYANSLLESLSGAGYRTALFTVRHGEASKNAENYIMLLDFLAANGITRTDVVAALGGGVVGDLAGFAAATFMRGVRFAQIPTTLLAAVDSSVGGKTAIDLEAGKNLAGAFYQPDIVVCDPLLLKSLPEDVLACGFAEVIKYGVIADSELFYGLEGHAGERLEEIITRCVEIKRDIVQADEFETGVRRLLNFGHTIGHAVEKLGSFRVSHGAAVAIGMAVFTRAAVRQGLCEPECCRDLERLLRLYDLPYTTGFSAEELMDAALSDKKRSGDTITVVLPERIGKCVLRELQLGELEGFIRPGLGRNGDI